MRELYQIFIKVLDKIEDLFELICKNYQFCLQYIFYTTFLSFFCLKKYFYRKFLFYLNFLINDIYKI